MTEHKPTILLIEDEPPIRKFLRVTLDAQGYKLVEAETFKRGLIEAASCQPDVILLDLGLPDGDGVELTRRIREFSKIPIIVISARDREQHKVDALDAGADDYLTKPFGVGELMARLRVALRHAQSTDSAGSAVFESGPLRVDLGARRVFVKDAAVHLTPNEYRLLSVLVKHAGKVLTHQQLLREVWGAHANEEAHYVRVYVNQLRQKLETDPANPKLIVTESGVGYRLEQPDLTGS